MGEKLIGKELKTPGQIKEAINIAMASSEALDGDCKECQARRICQVSEEDQNQLGRNWNIDIFNGECQGDCLAVIEQIARDIGDKYNAIW